MNYKQYRIIEKTAVETATPAIAVTMVAGGAGLIRNANITGQLTGRESLYHGTLASNVSGIREKGILASKAKESPFIKTVLKDIPRKKLLNKTYLARKKIIAQSIAISKDIMTGDIDSTGAVIRAKVPTWMLKEVDNPELRGAKTPREFYYKLMKKKYSDSKVLPISKAELQKYYDTYSRKGTAAFEGSIASKYIKGGKGYSLIGRKELMSYIKNRPGKFLKGLGKVTAGVGLIGIAGAMLTKNQRRMAEA